MNETVGDRLKEARLQAAVLLRRTVSQADMAELVSEQLGRTLHLTPWRRYETGEREPPLDVIKAAARVSGLSPGYIAFGDESNGFEGLDPTKDRGLTLEEAQRAVRQAQAERAAAREAEAAARAKRDRAARKKRGGGRSA